MGGVKVSVLPSSAVDRGFESPSGKTKDYKIGICCFSAKHAAVRRKCTGWLGIRIMCCLYNNTARPLICDDCNFTRIWKTLG